MNKKTVGTLLVIASVLAPYLIRLLGLSFANAVAESVVSLAIFALGPVGLYFCSKKNFPQNLLILLALWLCELCAWQWYVQTQLHLQGEALQRVNFNQAAAIQGYTNSIKNMDAEIAGLSARNAEFKKAAVTNDLAALEQKREILRLRSSSATMSNEIVEYKDVVDKLEAKLKEASQGILKQNGAIQQLVTERDAAIQKYNDSIKDRNALAGKYNSLVDRFNKLQAPAASEGAKP